MLFGRNYGYGKNHLTINGKLTLCAVPLENNLRFPLQPTNDNINDNTTCAICLERYENGIGNNENR